MRPMIGLAAIALCAPLFLSATSASAAAAAPAARNYDCTKAGNANKAVCKGAAPAAAKPAPAAPAAKPAAAAPAARNYDCSKPGNANKTVCKGAVAAAPAPAAKPAPMAAAKPPAPRPAPMVAARPANSNGRVVEWTTKTGKVVHYDCSKAGNLNKTACK